MARTGAGGEARPYASGNLSDTSQADRGGARVAPARSSARSSQGKRAGQRASASLRTDPQPHEVAVRCEHAVALEHTGRDVVFERVADSPLADVRRRLGKPAHDREDHLHVIPADAGPLPNEIDHEDVVDDLPEGQVIGTLRRLD